MTGSRVSNLDSWAVLRIGIGPWGVSNLCSRNMSLVKWSCVYIGLKHIEWSHTARIHFFEKMKFCHILTGVWYWFRDWYYLDIKIELNYRWTKFDMILTKFDIPDLTLILSNFWILGPFFSTLNCFLTVADRT